MSALKKFRNKSSIGGLIINRRVGEQISINNGEVLIELVEVRGKSVRIAFVSTKDIQIRRVNASDAV